MGVSSLVEAIVYKARVTCRCPTDFTHWIKVLVHSLLLASVRGESNSFNMTLFMDELLAPMRTPLVRMLSVDTWWRV